ncbi:MAG: pilus assembly protein [Armatimonadetes bacterium]|nr:pilus assembly protein [Armatimonadota bacterium]
MKMMRLGDNKGAALVEFAIVALLLFTMLLGIIEFGMLIKDYFALNQAVREGARSAALRSDETTIVNRVKGSALTLDPSRINNVNVFYRVYNSSSNSWGDWIPGTPPDTIAQYHVQVRVHAEYSHKLITGQFFSWLADGGDSITVRSEMVMRRE